jgi:hypothetical protein
MLRDATFYQELGADHFRRVSSEDQANRLAGGVKPGFTSHALLHQAAWFLFRGCRVA